MPKVKTEELKTTLNNLKSGLSQGKQTTEQSDCFVFLKDRIWTYNDEICVSCPTILDFNGAVSSREILSLIGKIAVEEMSVEISEEEMLLKAGRTKAGLRIQQEINMPIDQILVPKRWDSLPKNFLPSLQKCIFSAGTDFSRQVLTNINCAEDVVQSSDNERATQCLLTDSLKEPFLIPASSAKFLIQFDGVQKYKCDKEWVHFKTKDGVVFSCRCDYEEYPDLSKFFEQDGFEFHFPKQTIEILERAGVFADTEFEQDSLVTVSISSKGVLKIRAEGETGWIEETSKAKQKPGTDIQFSISPQYLQQILKQTDKAVIGSDLLWFSTEDFEHVVVLEN